MTPWIDIDEMMEQAQDEYEEEVKKILEKVAKVLTEDQLRLLQLSCSVSIH